MTTLREGLKAPKFSLCDKDGKTHGVGISKGDFTVVYFYPKDDTPGCTIEAKEFSEALSSFKTKKISVIGVSGGDQRSKEKFCVKHDLSLPLVSDTDFSVSRAYGVYGDKKFMGRVYKGIHRKTFVIDAKGVVVKIFDSVKPQGHAQEVLEAIGELRVSGQSRGKKSTGVSDKAPKRNLIAKGRGKK